MYHEQKVPRHVPRHTDKNVINHDTKTTICEQHKIGREEDFDIYVKKYNITAAKRFRAKHSKHYMY